MPRISCSTSISSDVRSKPCMDDETTQNPTSWVQLWGSNDFQGASLCAGRAFRRPYPWRQVFPEHAETCNSRNSEAHRNHFCHEHQWLKHQRLKFCLRQISMAIEWESYIQTKPAHRDGCIPFLPVKLSKRTVQMMSSLRKDIWKVDFLLVGA